MSEAAARIEAPSDLSPEEQARQRPRGKELRPILGLLPFLLRYKGVVVAAFAALLASTAVTLVLPLAVRLVIDEGFSRANADAIDRYFLALVVVAALMGITSSLRFFLVSWIGERVVTDIRSAVFDHVVGLSPSFFETNRTGEVLSRLTADTTLIKTVVGSTTSLALRSAFTLVGAVILLVFTSPKLSGLVLLAIPLTALPIVGFGRLVRSLSRKSQDRLADTNVFAGEALSFIQTLQAFTHEAADRLRYREVVEAAFAAARQRLQARALLTALALFLVFSLISAVLWVGAQAVLADEMSGGELGQFMIYAVLCATSMATLTEIWGEIQLAAGAAERLFELLAAVPAIAAPEKPTPLPEPPRGEVHFEGVDFVYPTRPETTALGNFSLDALPGEKVAIVGPSGAGKSTVLRLLLRFYDPQGGRITLDGVDLRELDPRALRGRIAIVPQETAVFTDSVLENIRYGRPGASDDEVRSAAEVASADEFIAALPEGYATQLGENGMTLSGGQRQRIAIARAVLKDAPLLLLDEATSSLDSHNERLVQQALQRLEQGRVTIVIAHRLSTVVAADRIIVVESGRVVAQGTHAELVAEGGLYGDLARLQLHGDPVGRHDFEATATPS